MGSTGASLRASLLPDSRKGLLDVGARKEKEREDLLKHHIIQRSLSGAWPHFPLTSKQVFVLAMQIYAGCLDSDHGANLAGPLGELGVIWESNISLSVKCSQDYMSLLHLFQQK